MKKSGWSFANWLKGKDKMSAKDWILILIVIIGVAFVCLLLFKAAWETYRNKKIHHILPEAQTTAYLELTDQSVPNAFDRDFLVQLKTLNEAISKKYGIEYEDIKQYTTQDQMGLALIKNSQNQNDMVTFFKSHHQKKLIEYFESLTLETETLTTDKQNGGVIYSYPQSYSFSFAFFGPYLFLSESTEALSTLRSVNAGEIPYLNQRAAFQKSAGHLPRNAWLRSTVDFQQLTFENFPAYQQMLSPLKNLVDHLSIAVRQDTNGFHFNTLLSIEPENLINEAYQSDESAKFSYQLAQFIPPQSLAAYIGGSNLTEEWQNTLENISHFNPAYGIILEGLLRAQLNKLFGDEVSLRDDVYPLFKGEYAFTVENSVENETSEANSSNLSFKLILRHNDIEFTQAKLEKLAEGFRFLGAQFSPKLRTFILPDNTESKELVADQNTVIENSKEYKNSAINCLQVKETNYQFCYAVSDQVAIISNQPQSIKESLDLIDHPELSLLENHNFKRTLNQLSKISDEITFIQFENLNQLLANSKIANFMSKLPNSFDTAGWVKHYFADGVSTEGYVLLK